MKGFTFIELLFTMVILALFVVFGFASFEILIEKNEKQIIQDEIKNILAFAKMKAIHSANCVYLSPVDSTKDWSKGMLLSQFDVQNNQLKPVEQWQFKYPQWTVKWSGVHSSQNIPFSNNPIHSMSNGRFTIKNRNTQEEFVIVLNRLGRVRSQHE